jgi:hypothetical protein
MQGLISGAIIWILQESDVTLDFIQALLDAPYALKELGHHTALYRAKHVQPDNLPMIIWVVLIVQLEAILSRCPRHAFRAASEKFRIRSQDHAFPAKPEVSQTTFSMFAPHVLLDLSQTQWLTIASPVTLGNILHEKVSVVKTVVHLFIPLLRRSLVRNVRLDNIPRRKRLRVPHAHLDQK